MTKTHFILLASADQVQRTTRQFYEYDSRDAIAQSMVDLFEDYLISQKSNLDHKENTAGFEDIEYTTDELFSYMDKHFGELVCLVKDEKTDLWCPYATNWIKESVYLSMKRACTEESNKMDVELN